jgi:two-component system OmpR family response regulator
MRVLIVEDEAKMAGLIRKGLRQEGMAADIAAKGEDALWMAGSTEYDAIVLDLMLPGIDGFEVCRRLRGDGVWSPILMLTARDGVADRVTGLDAGADDYLVKPFSYAELLARVCGRSPGAATVSARPSCGSATCASIGQAAGLEGRGGDRLLRQGIPAVLEVFMLRPGEVLSRFQLLEHAWDYEYENRSNIVDSYVRLLRRKIDKPFGTQSIQTVRGAGYRLRENGGGA